jgi:hypothetical protein
VKPLLRSALPSELMKGTTLLDRDPDRRHVWLSLIGIAAIGLIGLVLMAILTP